MHVLTFDAFHQLVKIHPQLRRIMVVAVKTDGFLRSVARNSRDGENSFQNAVSLEERVCTLITNLFTASRVSCDALKSNINIIRPT